MDFYFLKRGIKKFDEKIRRLTPRKRALVVLVGIVIIVLVFFFLKKARDAAVEKARNDALNNIRTQQSQEIELLRRAAIRAGNVPKGTATQQKKTLDTAHKAIPGPKASLEEQAKELNALRAMSLANEMQSQ